MAGYDPTKRNQELQKQGLVANPTYAKPVGGLTPKGVQLPVQNPEAIGTQPFVPGATLNKLQTMNQLPNVQPAPAIPALGAPSAATTGAINNAFAGNVQPPPLKTAQAAVTQPVVQQAPPAQQAEPPQLAVQLGKPIDGRGGWMRNEQDGSGYTIQPDGTIYKIGADGTQSMMRGASTPEEEARARQADDDFRKSERAKNEAFSRESKMRAELLRNAEYRDPAMRAALNAATIGATQQTVELAKQQGMDEAATQAAAAKGAADVQSAQLKEQGATKRTQAGNDAAMARTKANNDAAMARQQAKPAAPQRPLTLMDANGVEQAYMPDLKGATLIPMTVGGTAPAARQLPSGVDSKAAFAEAKAFIAQNPWAKEQVRARLQEYGLDPAGLDNG
jgi:hypothetical protein